MFEELYDWWEEFRLYHRKDGRVVKGPVDFFMLNQGFDGILHGVDTGEKDANGKAIISHRYGFHTLRHAAASLFIQHLKWSPKRIQTVMGHSSVRMTFDLYGHLFEDIEKDRADMATIEAAIRAA